MELINNRRRALPVRDAVASKSRDMSSCAAYINSPQILKCGPRSVQLDASISLPRPRGLPLPRPRHLPPPTSTPPPSDDDDYKKRGMSSRDEIDLNTEPLEDWILDPPDGVQVEPLESGGLTVPTAQTSFAGVDVKDGIEVYRNEYACHASFSVRIDTYKDSKWKNKKRKYMFVCQKAGVNKKVKAADDGPITEKKMDTLPCPHDCQKNGAWSLAELPYTKGDTKNLRQGYRAEYRGKDVKATLDYFEELKKEDPEFYYSYSLDEFDRIENIFWVDGEAKKAYEL
ncbi:hypothetical protein U9M48_024999 [Paspalum notatum var. saurae]|uniref:FAR1 domain-containing protein n=1 Tax=Paspalum notatum var. saurae TaxID=547442 RepID=A0AAQ3WWM8_PASNO